MYLSLRGLTALLLANKKFQTFIIHNKFAISIYKYKKECLSKLIFVYISGQPKYAHLISPVTNDTLMAALQKIDELESKYQSLQTKVRRMDKKRIG